MMPTLKRTRWFYIFVFVLVYIIFDMIMYLAFGTISPQDLLNIALSRENGSPAVTPQPNVPVDTDTISHVPDYQNWWPGEEDHDYVAPAVGVATSAPTPDQNAAIRRVAQRLEAVALLRRSR